MKQLLLFAFILFTSFNSFAQINPEDSTVQVIGYWDLNEKQTYEVTREKYRVKDADTTRRELVKYEVDITIIDSTATSYTIEWLYRHVSAATDNSFERKLEGITNNRRVVIKTDEMGTIEEVVNWQEIRDEIKETTKVLRKEFKHIPNINLAVAKAEGMFSTKEAIEAMAVKDIQQFYTFHGAKYALGEEVKGQLPIYNNLGGAPFSADVAILLDEINEEDNNYVLWVWQTIDPEQLTEATYAFLKENTPNTGTTIPSKSEFPAMQNETTTAARIHGSGWVLYSRETKEITADGTLAFEERTIEIK